MAVYPALFFQRTLEIARAAEIYETTLRLIHNHVGEGHRYNLSSSSSSSSSANLTAELSEQHLDLIANMSGCQKFTAEPSCSDMCFHYKYRFVSSF